MRTRSASSACVSYCGTSWRTWIKSTVSAMPSRPAKSGAARVSMNAAKIGAWDCTASSVHWPPRVAAIRSASSRGRRTSGMAPCCRAAGGRGGVRCPQGPRAARVLRRAAPRAAKTACPNPPPAGRRPQGPARRWWAQGRGRKLVARRPCSPLGHRVLVDGLAPPVAARLGSPRGLQAGAILGPAGERGERERLDEQRHNQALELLDLPAAFHGHVRVGDVVDQELRNAALDVGPEMGVVAARLQVPGEARELIGVDAGGWAEHQKGTAPRRMAAIVRRAPRCRMTGDVLDGGGGGGGATGTRRAGDGGPAAGGGGRRPGPGGGGVPRPRAGATRSTGSAIATRPRTGRGGGPGGGVLAPFMGGTRAFALVFPTAPRLRAMSGRPVCLAPPGCVKPPREFRGRHACGARRRRRPRARAVATGQRR